jgi:hypothetical protein
VPRVDYKEKKNLKPILKYDVVIFIIHLQVQNHVPLERTRLLQNVRLFEDITPAHDTVTTSIFALQERASAQTTSRKNIKCHHTRIHLHSRSGHNSSHNPDDHSWLAGTVALE